MLEEHGLSSKHSRAGGIKKLRIISNKSERAPPIKLKSVLSKRPSLLGHNEATRNSEQCDIKG
jgi:hypothetical protein